MFGIFFFYPDTFQRDIHGLSWHFVVFFATICGGKNAETLIQRSYTHIYIYDVYICQKIFLCCLVDVCIKSIVAWHYRGQIHEVAMQGQFMNLLCPSASSMGSGDIKPENVMLDACLVMI